MCLTHFLIDAGDRNGESVNTVLVLQKFTGPWRTKKSEESITAVIVGNTGQ